MKTPADMRMAQVHGRLVGAADAAPGNGHAWTPELVRQLRKRIDFRWLGPEELEATITVYLPNGRVMRATERADISDVPAPDVPEVGKTSTDKVADPYHRMRVSYLYQHGRMANSTPQAQGWWDGLSRDRRGQFKRWYAVMVDRLGAPTANGLWRPWIEKWKSLPKAKRDALYEGYGGGDGMIGTVLKAIVTSEAAQTMGQGLATAAPFLGPAAPLAKAGAAAFQVGSKLAGAHGAEKAGATGAMGAIVDIAKGAAGAIAPGLESTLLSEANTMVKRAMGAGAPALDASTLVDAVRRGGRVLSNKSGSAAMTELLQAHKLGRVFVIS